MTTAYQPNKNDIFFMELAIEQALLAKQYGEIPVGAIIIDNNNQIIGQGFNKTILNNDPTAHAEITALRAASQFKSNYRIPETTLYVTLEPCLMCLGAIIHARVKNVIYGASDKKTGVCGGLLDLHQESRINHQTTVKSGVMQSQCSQLLVDFFKERRAAKTKAKLDNLNKNQE